ncbi:MAG TPA: hypothetical protein VFS42_04205 [Burkholderiaceae bacterium]|nr:hypothetical protein [Burkholderiaceae bacterium]
MSYAGLTGVEDKKEAHLGGNIAEGDPFTYSPSVWDYLMKRFAIKSVLDLGSGSGYAADYFYRAGAQVIAVEGLRDNVVTSTYPAIYMDLTKSSVFCNVDLVHCQEVVEHIEEKYLDNLLASLCCGKFIVMSNALPGQGGYHHVNEQPTEYWIKHLQRYSCQVLVEDTNRIRKLAAQDGAVYLAKTGLVLANKTR